MKKVKVKFVVDGLFETDVLEFSTKKEAKEAFRKNRKSGCSKSIYTEIIFL